MGSLFFEGLFLQASLIFALGAQNLFVLESGLQKQHPFTVSFVCFFCDLTLILLGVAGAATIFTKFPEIKILVGIIGVGFLFMYGLEKFLSGAMEKKISTNGLESTFKKSVLLSMTFSILNPHAYLDAFIIIGGFSSKYPAMQDRVVLGLGAAVYSGIWFLLLSTMSSFMRPVLEHPRRMKAFMSLAGLALMYLAGKLGMDVLHWINNDYHPLIGMHNFTHFPLPPGKMFTSILY